MAERDHNGDDMIQICLNFNNVIENNGLIDFSFLGLKFIEHGGSTWKTRKQAIRLC